MTQSKLVQEQEIFGNKLECPVCKHNKFWSRETLMNTPGLTFFGLEWANRRAQNYICEQCGHILWFMRPV